MRRCLEKSPEQRFQSASDLAFALEALSESAPSSKTMPALAPALARPRLRPALIGAGIAIALGLTFLLGRYTGKTPPASPSFNRLTFRRGNLSRARIAPVTRASWRI